MNELESGAQIQWLRQRRCLGFSHTLLQPYPNMRLSLAISPLWKDRIRDHRRPAKRRGWRRTESNIPHLVPSKNLIRCPSLRRHSIINDLSGSETIFTLLERGKRERTFSQDLSWFDWTKGEGRHCSRRGRLFKFSQNTNSLFASDGKSFLSGM